MGKKLSWFDRLMAAVTFAEANEHAKGKDFLSVTESRTDKQKNSKEQESFISTDLHTAEAKS